MDKLLYLYDNYLAKINPDVACVYITIFLVTWLPFTSQIFIIYPWLNSENYFNSDAPSFTMSTKTVAFLISFNFALVMLWMNYYKACNTDAGSLPDDWEIHNKMPPSENPNFHCKKCNRYKPTRAHHCSVCKRCILRMDHHCPWVGRCVGFYNYSYFLRFLVYVDITCWYCMALLLARVWDLLHKHAGYFYFSEEYRSYEPWLLIVNCLLLVPVILGVGVLTIQTLYYTLQNITVIDSYEKDRVQTLLNQGKLTSAPYPFDLGAFENFKQVMGPKWWLWPFPVNTMQGDGIVYEVAKKFREEPVEWPPLGYEKTSYSSDEEPSPFIETQTHYHTGDPRHPRYKPQAHVRKDSEGYVVKQLTMEDRERMLREYEMNLEYKKQKLQEKRLRQQQKKDNPLYSESSSNSESETNSSIYDSSDLDELFPNVQESPKIQTSPKGKQGPVKGSSLGKNRPSKNTGQKMNMSEDSDDDNKPLASVVEKVRRRKK